MGNAMYPVPMNLGNCTIISVKADQRQAYRKHKIIHNRIQNINNHIQHNENSWVSRSGIHIVLYGIA